MEVMVIKCENKEKERVQEFCVAVDVTEETASPRGGQVKKSLSSLIHEKLRGFLFGEERPRNFCGSSKSLT